MRFLLDTNIVSAHLKGDGRIFNRFIQHAGGLAVSVICTAELYTWVERGRGKVADRTVLDNALSEMSILPIDQTVARKFGEINAMLLNQGRPLPGLDLLIGCSALVYDLTLVTHNTQDFKDIPGLRVEDWLA